MTLEVFESPAPILPVGFSVLLEEGQYELVRSETNRKLYPHLKSEILEWCNENIKDDVTITLWPISSSSGPRRKVSLSFSNDIDHVNFKMRWG